MYNEDEQIVGDTEDTEIDLEGIKEEVLDPHKQTADMVEEVMNANYVYVDPGFAPPPEDPITITYNTNIRELATIYVNSRKEMGKVVMELLYGTDMIVRYNDVKTKVAREAFRSFTNGFISAMNALGIKYLISYNNQEDEDVQKDI